MKRNKGKNDDAWRHAKKVCRLSARHVEMARALGMNPKKLPGLRPAAGQQWKLPVREFIEECYSKRFGGADDEVWLDDELPAEGPARVPNPIRQAEDLVRWLNNAADDVARRLADRSVDATFLAELASELHDVADAVGRGESPGQVPLLPAATRGDPTPADDDWEPDDDIPF